MVDGYLMNLCLIHSPKTPLSLGLTGTEDVASYLFTITQPTMLIVLLVERHETDVNMRKSGSTTIWRGTHDICGSGSGIFCLVAQRSS